MSLNTQKIKAALSRDMRGLCDALGIVPNKSHSTRQQLRSGSNGSVSVVLSGEEVGSWFDYELETGGGPFELIQRELGFIDWRDAVDWARNYLGDVDLPFVPKKKAEPPVDIDVEAMEKAARARNIWSEAGGISGTPGENYLHNRGIKPEIWPNSIRWHGGGYLVFGICHPQGRVHAIQRIYIKPDGTPKLAGGKKIKRSLSPRMGRAVIFPGVDGPICIAEGPETALSVWCATGYETRAALGSLESVDLEKLPQRDIILCRDDDPTEHIDSKRQKQVKNVRMHRRTGCTVLECFPYDLRRGDKNDFNDLLQSDGPDVIWDRINAIATPVSSRGGHPLSDARTELKSSMQEAVGEILLAQSYECSVDLSKYDGIPKFTLPADAANLQVALRIDLGVGKTEEAIRVAIDWVKSGNGPVTFAVPTHAVGTELEARIRNTGSDIKVATWRGREADDPSIPGNLDLPKEERVLMCRDTDAVRDVQAVGGAPQATVCNPKRGPGCKFYPCRYTDQFQQQADIWIVAHQALFSQRPESVPQPSLLIIDEAFWQAGLYGADYDSPKRITSEMVKALPDHPRGNYPTADLQAELMPLRKAILPLFDANAITPGMITLTAEQCRKAAQLELKRKLPDIIVAGLTPAKRRDVLKRNHVNAELGRISRFWNTLAELVEDGGTSGRLTPETVEENGITYRAIRITGIRKITSGWEAPTLHIDGTMDLALVEPWLPRIDLIADVKAETTHQTVRQYYSRSFSLTSLKTDAAIDKLWWWCLAEARWKGGVWLLIVQKDAEESIKARHTIPNFISIAHHNGITGRDDWKDVTGAFIVGRIAPPPKAVETISGSISGQRVESLNGWYLKRNVRIGNVTVDADAHPDAFAERVRHAICEDQVVQGAGRPRGVNRTADNPVELALLSNLPLDIDVDQALEWMPPSKDDQLWAKYGVWVESVGDAAKILGISRNTMKSARWREQSHAGCIPFIYPFIENAPTVSFGTYKRIGRQNRKQRTAWDSRTITDIESFLTDRLGAPVILGIEETKPAEIKTMPPLNRLFDAPAPLGYSIGSAELFELSGFELKGQTAVPARFVRAFYPATNNPPAIISIT